MTNEPRPTGGSLLWKVATVVLIIGIIGIYVYGKGGAQMTDAEGNKTQALTADKAAEELIAFINEIYGASIGEVKLKEVTEQDGLYKVSLDIPNNQQGENIVFTTKDAKLFIPQAINLKETRDQKTASENTNTSTSQQVTAIPKTDKPTVELFTMSYCPYGNQAEDGIIPVIKLLGKEVEVVPHYVVYANYQGGGPNYCIDKDSKYCSMHGVKEAEQDVRELCIYKYNKDKYWDYISKVNTACTVANIDTCWETPAKELKIDTAKISKCLTSEGETMMANETQLNQKYDVTGSPTLVINSSTYQGGRSAEDFKLAICNAFNTPPELCNQTLGATATTATGECN